MKKFWKWLLYDWSGGYLLGCIVGVIVTIVAMYLVVA